MSSATGEDTVLHRGRPAGRSRGAAVKNDPRTFWVLDVSSQRAGAKQWRRAFQQLVSRVNESPGVTLFDAVEAGVPTYLVHLVAGATGETASNVMDLIGVSQTTFRRKEEANEPLPEVAAHRVMGFLRVAATLRRLLEESGDPEQLQDFDLEGWIAHWMRERLPALGDRTPAEMLRNPEGLRAVEQVLERMRGGLPA